MRRQVVLLSPVPRWPMLEPHREEVKLVHPPHSALTTRGQLLLPEHCAGWQYSEEGGAWAPLPPRVQTWVQRMMDEPRPQAPRLTVPALLVPQQRHCLACYALQMQLLMLTAHAMAGSSTVRRP